MNFGLLFAIVLAIAGFSWWLVPIITGLPWRPTSASRTRRALEMAKARPGELLFDLGAGDGRVALLAAREFGLQSVGVEISPLHCLIGWVFARLTGMQALVKMVCADFYKTDLGEADIVFAYMTSAQVARLKPFLLGCLKPGARLVTISFDMDGWEPYQVDRDLLIFLYEMPPTPGSLESYLSKNF
jgi:hypothetical protein